MTRPQIITLELEDCSDALAEYVARLESLLDECSSDLEYEIDAKYDGMLDYPTMKSGYDSEMAIVLCARQILGVNK